MENNFLTSGDLALWEARRGYSYGNEHGCHRGGAATTAIGLAAGLGGSALLLGIAAAWGVNQASKARQEGNKNTLDALTQNVQNLTSFAFNERASREAWQNHHMPTIGQFVDVRTGSQAVSNSVSSAYANAESQIVADALTGRSQICPQAVSLYSAPQPCACPASNPCGCGCN